MSKLEFWYAPELYPLPDCTLMQKIEESPAEVSVPNRTHFTLPFAPVNE